MKRKKMLLSMMLMAALIVGMLPATALAAENEAGEPTEITVQVEEEVSKPVETAAQHCHPLCGYDCPDGLHNDTIFDQTLNSSNGTLTIGGNAATQDGDYYVLKTGHYYLADNVDLDKGITIQGDAYICLNNNQIKLSAKGAVFTVNGNGNELTLTDCGKNGTVSHSATYLGSGVAVNKGAAFNMYGGEISNNASANGVRMIKGSFNMYGGRITNNTDTSSGGGVYAYESTFNMYGGEISGNRVENANYNTNGGGGVWVKDGTFCMSGGSITGNTAYRNGSYGQGGGVRCIGNTKVELSGSPVIKDNGVSTGVVNNLYVDTGSSNVMITGALTTGAEIRMVKNGENVAAVALGVDASNANQHIICDDDTGYEASYDADSHMIKWTVPTHTHVWTDWVSNGDGTHTRTCQDNPDHIQTEKCSGGTATCKDKAVCTICYTAYGDFAPHDFDNSTWGYKGADGHAHVCKTSGCTATDTVIAHTPGAAATEDMPQTCTECGYEITPALNHEHNWSAWTSNSDGTHTRTCLDHPEHTQTEKCSGGTATCKDKAVCTICNTAYGELNPANHVGGMEVRNYVAATTEAAGYTGDTWCKGCNTKIADGTTIPKLNSSSDDDDDDDTPAVSDSGNNTSAGAAASPVIEDYTIKRGDTLGAIAKKYGCTVAELVAANSDLIKNPNRIHIGWKLKIPQHRATGTMVAPTDNNNSDAYIIKPGDSLWAIARRYGCTVADIVKMNSNLITMPDRIRVGWQLNMPVK